MQPTDEHFARELDRQDELACYRQQFVVQDADLIYLDGNSLGRLPQRTISVLQGAVTHEWGQQLIRAWNTSWFEVSSRVGAKIAQLIGARDHEVIVADSTSTNLYKLALAVMQARTDRDKIVTDELNFPSDLYVLQGLAHSHPSRCRLETVRARNSRTIDAETIAASIDPRTALVALSHVLFQSGRVQAMKDITTMAHDAGAWMLWDLCHSVGVLPIDVNACGVDLAIGCTYKYLSGGPGAPAFLFVREQLQNELLNPIWGWFACRDQFEFAAKYQPATGVLRFQTGTPPILSLLAIEPGVDLVLEAGLERIRKKSMRQTEYLHSLWRQILAPLGFRWDSPEQPVERGSHVSLGHPEAWRITQALVQQMNVIPDFRTPDNIRLGIAPLYVTFTEIYQAVMRIQQVVVERTYEKYTNERTQVT